MARTLDELIAHGEELAERFESTDDRSMFGEPSIRSMLGLAAMRRARAERDLRRAVVTARGQGVTWDEVGEILGVSGEAARKRYARAVETEQASSGGSRERGVGAQHVEPNDVRPAEGRFRENVMVLFRDAQAQEARRFEENLEKYISEA